MFTIPPKGSTPEHAADNPHPKAKADFFFRELSTMTNKLPPSLTPDLVMTVLIASTEANLKTLITVSNALACLSQMALNTVPQQKIDVSQLGALIGLCDYRVDQLIDDMREQLEDLPTSNPPDKK